MAARKLGRAGCPVIICRRFELDRPGKYPREQKNAISDELWVFGVGYSAFIIILRSRKHMQSGRMTDDGLPRPQSTADGNYCGAAIGVNTMKSTFTKAYVIEREKLDWGTRAWHTGYGKARADNLVVIEVDLQPGFGHAFHLHANQEELVYVIDGEVEQWIGEEKKTLRKGDSAFFGANVVHASYNVSTRPAKVLAILGPVIGEDGYEVEEVADRAPWKSLGPNVR